IVGLTTAIVATSITRAQSSIKTQIAYASITQIGIMFIELAAGLEWLVLLHFVSNASLRTYQLLISPSVVSYLIHDQFFYFVRPIQKIKNTLLGKMRATLYVLSIKEWNMNTAVSHYLWKPLKVVGRACAALDWPPIQIASLALFLSFASIAMLLTNLVLFASIVAAVTSLIFYIRAYTTKGAAAAAWNLIMLGHLFGALFLASASVTNWQYLVMYGVGIVVAFVLGHICFWYLKTKNQPSMLEDYQGVVYAFPKLGSFFFVVSLLFMAFPISTSFLAQDILLSLISANHIVQIGLFCLAYLLVGVSIMRLYTKVFLGPHKTSYHEKAYRSS
ncbi:MAG TPA: proton-conducting transporter membrane subunit, partial [Magnetospirillaceae bacterium]|nr:proton-conducting transporter membrane subunit [Magnetospirillaceae bacterium]